VRRTKIIATVGPATDSEARLRELIAAGVDVFRLNFSHGTHDAHAEVVARIRALAPRSEPACFATMHRWRWRLAASW